MEDIIIELQNVCKSFYFQKVLTNINLTVRRGESIALVGGDGNGKSTIMRIMVGLSKPSKGKIFVDKKTKFAYIPDKYEKSNLKVQSFLKFMAEIDGHYDQEAVKRYCEMFKLKDKMYVPMEELSERDLHKVAIIQALIADPDVIFMDEPLYKQDQESKFYFLQEVKRRKKQGLTIIMACHDYYLINQLKATSYKVDRGTLVSGEAYVDGVLRDKDYFLFYKDDDLEDLDFEILEVAKDGDN